MKQQLFSCLLATASLLFIFTSCDKNDDPQDETVDLEIKATVDQGSRYNATVATVKALIYFTEDGMESYEVASGKYESGGFRMTLPASVPAKYLVKCSDELKEIVSNPAALYAGIQLYAYSQSGDELGEFYLFDEDLNVECLYLYADRPFTLKGTGEDGDKYDCAFNTGWNLYYNGYDDTNDNWYVTTVMPQNASFKYFFYEY